MDVSVASQTVNFLMSFDIVYVLVTCTHGFYPSYISADRLSQVGRSHELILWNPRGNDRGDDWENFLFFPALQVGSGMGSARRGRLGRANDEVEFGISILTGREQFKKQNGGASDVKLSFHPDAQGGKEVLGANIPATVRPNLIAFQA